MQVLQLFRRLPRLLNGPRPEIGAFSLALVLLHHPLDAFDIIKRERESKRFRLFALLLIVLAFAVRYIYQFLVSFQLQQKDTSSVNLPFELGIVFIPVFAWVMASFCMTSILGGESKMGEILTTTGYCLVPYIVMTPLFGLLSHVLSSTESGFFVFFRSAVLVWVFLLLFAALARQNDYGFWKAVIVGLLSLLCMAVILVLAVLLIALSMQLVLTVQDFGTRSSKNNIYG